MEDATFSLSAGTLRIQTALSPTMLPVVLNADAERILKAALREAGSGALKLALLPGAPSVAVKGATKSARPAASGSAAELAEKHPIVQQAKRIFAAEISNVIDLREKG